MRPDVPARLGVGPMSRNVVDAVIRLAYRRRRPVMVIASRNQVDLRGGYVEGWTTETFAAYVRERDPDHLIVLCRDHGGPWQHPGEAGLGEREAMAAALRSLSADIDSGLGLLHIDTSRENGAAAGFDDALSRLVTLYRECQEFARERDRPVLFEVGLEEQGADADDPADFAEQVECILNGLAKESLQPPAFVVGQTGTKVSGMENHGALVREPRATGGVVGELARTCWRHGLALKAHNVDYLPGYALAALIRAGTDAVNVAPEFGVVETRTVLGLLAELGLTRERERFLRLAYESGAWRKWYADGHATDLQRATAAGHYVFATDAFRAIRRTADAACRGTTVDAVVGTVLDHTLDRYANQVWGTT